MIWRLQFPYTSPPLTANQRMHWARKAKITARLRAEACARAVLAGIPALDYCEVQLTWYVRDKRRRDVDNVVPTLKAICDGLVDAHLVNDDTPNLMHKFMPTIVHTPGAVPYLELTITTRGEAVA